MTSRVPWSVEGIEPTVRDRAEAAARRAGMSLNEWLNANIGEPAPESRNAAEVAEIHSRLDSITRQIEQISRGAGTNRGDSSAAQQLNEAISRLDARLSQITGPAQQAQEPQTTTHVRHRPTQPQYHAAPIYRQAPTTIPELVEFDLARIIAHQSRPGTETPWRDMPPPTSGQMPPAAGLSGFETQLRYLTGQIESLRRPDGIDQAITTLRSELAHIRQAITEAMPRRALESLENEIRSVAQKIDESRQSGVDGVALQSVEHALRDIHVTLRTLTPAEQLAGFDDAIRTLGSKIDLIVRANPDSGSMRQLESAISALRTIVPNVASNEALSRLSDEVKVLASSVNQLLESSELSQPLAALEQRIAALTTALETRDPPTHDPNRLETAVRMLSDRIDHLQIGTDTSSTFAHVEQRILQLLERLEASDTRVTNLGRVEKGLSDILRHLEEQRVSLAAFNAIRTASPSGMDQDIVGAVRRELSDMRFSQSEIDRKTQDALESVHNALGHVVDRLAMIEGDIREARATKHTPYDRPAAPAAASRVMAFSATLSPELSNPATFDSSSTRTPVVPSSIVHDSFSAAAIGSRGDKIGPNPSPNYRTKPGSGALDSPSASPTPSQRIAASESILSELPPVSSAVASTSNFIAAARRAAQAAANPTGESFKENSSRLAESDNAVRANSRAAKRGTKTGARIRALLVGASIVLMVLSGFTIIMSLLDGGEMPAARIEQSAERHSAEKYSDEKNLDEKNSDEKKLETSTDTMVLPSGSNGAVPPSAPEPALPSLTSPTPIDRQSRIAPAVPILQPAVDNDVPKSQPTEAMPVPPDVTGSIFAPQSYSTPVMTPRPEELPDTIGGPVLRIAALKGDPSAAYEIALRFAEGRGTPINYVEAAKWYSRAAEAGIVPAMFRLGTLYEKGFGEKKDLNAAKHYYIRAAERGNAKAMHNLAVLDAEGRGNAPNYRSAAQWFQKAAERGVSDSQFNLGILYARGIGVEQNLPESYKWFGLAAAQGDADSSRKRDDVAKRLDAESLAAAKLAIQTFVAERQPSDAINVAVPTAGWDSFPVPAPKRAAKPDNKQSAAMR